MKQKPYFHAIIAGALLLAVLAAYTFWYRTVSQRSAEAAALRGELYQKGEASERLALARRALDELAQDEAQIYAHFISPSDIVPFLENLEATGRSLGSSVEVATVGNTPGKPGSLSLSLRISGSFDAVVRTLGAIEYQPFDTTLASLALDTPARDGKWVAAVVFQVGTTPSIATTTPAVPTP